MSLKIAAAGVAGAAVLGLLLGARLTPTLATRAEGPVAPLETSVGSDGPADLTPPYVGPESLRALRADATPTAWPDRVEGEVRRDLAQADAQLRASEAELAEYHRAALLVSDAAATADRWGAMFSPDRDLGEGGRPAVSDPADAREGWAPDRASNDDAQSEPPVRYAHY